MKVVPGVSPREPLLLWMRFRFGVFLLLAATFASTPTPARAAWERPLLVGVSGGARFFDDQADLGSAPAFGGRLGVGVTNRLTVLLDLQTSSPERKSSHVGAHVTAFRALVQGRILAGAIRPYLILGGGALLFNYGDAYDGVGGILTVGSGVESRVAPRTSLFVEATADVYGTETVIRTFDGFQLRSSPNETLAAPAVSAGIAVEF